MIPLAASGLIVIGGAVSGALLLVWVLLRADARENAEQDAEEEAAQQAEQEAAQQAGQQAAPPPEHDGVTPS